MIRMGGTSSPFSITGLGYYLIMIRWFCSHYISFIASSFLSSTYCAYWLRLWLLLTGEDSFCSSSSSSMGLLGKLLRMDLWEWDWDYESLSLLSTATGAFLLRYIMYFLLVGLRGAALELYGYFIPKFLNIDSRFTYYPKPTGNDAFTVLKEGAMRLESTSDTELYCEKFSK